MKTSKTDIRTAIGQHVARAISSTQEDDSALNVHNWIEITTDRIVNEILAHLPEPIDIVQKYELNPKDTRGVYVSFDTQNMTEEQNGEQLMYAARFADDQGYNRYHQELVRSIKSLYKLPEDSVL